MNVAVLSHRSGNIGHLFMSLGVERLLKETFGDQLQIDHFEQHKPLSVLRDGHPLHTVDGPRHGRLRVIRRALDRESVTRRLLSQTRDVSKYSLVVACGGPNLIRDGARAPEMNLMFHLMYGAFRAQGRTVLDVAVGGCFPMERLPASIDEAFTPADRQTYDRLLAATSFTTARDRLAQMLLRGLGREAPLIPCTAIAAGREFLDVAERGAGHILINYQAKGANEDWGQGVDERAWANEVRTLAKALVQRHRVVFICHDDREERIATALGVDAPVVRPKDWREYASLAVKAKAAFVSRVHAALPLAGVGVPTIAVGTDSRLMALDAAGIPTTFVKAATAASIEHDLEAMIANGAAESERLTRNVNAAMQAYRDLFAEWGGA